jgi:hypothetical protein
MEVGMKDEYNCEICESELTDLWQPAFDFLCDLLGGIVRLQHR